MNIEQHALFSVMVSKSQSASKKPWRSLFFFAFALHVAVIPTNCKAISCSQPRTQAALVIFGDSILDAGNNNYINTTVAQQANFWPYGQTHFNFSTGRFCDGRLIGDFVAQYANLPLIPPFLQPDAEYYDGANFASGGAGALDETFQQDRVISLRTQLSYYVKVKDWLTRKLGSDGANSVTSNAVHLFSIGANDYFSFAMGNSAAPELHSRFFVGLVLGNFTTVIEEIYKIGGRKFAFINVPPVGCHPMARTFESDNGDSCFDQLSFLTRMHNQAMSQHLVQLEKKLRGFKYSLFDMNSEIHKRIENPAKYGLKHGKLACCGGGKYGEIYSCGGMGEDKKFNVCENPHEYVFWDAVHLTEISYKQFAEQMWSGGHDPLVVGPYNLKKLFQLEAIESPLTTFMSSF